MSVYRFLLTPVSRRYHERNAEVIYLTQRVLHFGLRKYTINRDMFRTDGSIFNTKDVKVGVANKRNWKEENECLYKTEVTC
jgi:hypothetical protein